MEENLASGCVGLVMFLLGILVVSIGLTLLLGG